MFDAKSILDAIVAGSSEQTRGVRESGGLGDIMGDILRNAPRDGGGQPQMAPRSQGLPGGGAESPAGNDPLGDILGKLGGGSQGQGGGGMLDDILRKLGEGQSGGQGGQGSGGILDDILGKLGRGGQPGGSQGQGGGGGGMLDDILGELTRGRQGQQGSDNPIGDILRRLGESQSGGGQGGPGGGGGMLDDILGKLGRGGEGGQSAPGGAPDYGQMLERIKDLVGQNKGAAGAIIGGLGGLLLGTRAGRSLAGRAVRLGGLALIGALAYKALKNFQQGTPVEGGRGLEVDLPQPPGGSGFEADSMGNNEALLFIRTMVAAAAADGKVDRDEQQKILGQLEQAGLDQEAMQFLAEEFNNPASIDAIVAQVRTREQAAQVYTAARIAIEPDTREEQAFLSELSGRLDLDSRLAAHIDAAAMGIKVR